MSNQTNAPKIVCSWCQTVMRPGVEPISHGLCPACEAREMSTAELGIRLLELADEREALAIWRRGPAVERALAERIAEALVLRAELLGRSHRAELEGILARIEELQGEHTDRSTRS